MLLNRFKHFRGCNKVGISFWHLPIWCTCLNPIHQWSESLQREVAVDPAASVLQDRLSAEEPFIEFGCNRFPGNNSTSFDECCVLNNKILGVGTMFSMAIEAILFKNSIRLLGEILLGVSTFGH